MTQQSQQVRSQLTWREIGRTILLKSQEDYRSKVRPTLRTGKTRVGAFLVTLGRKIQGETR